MASLTRPVNVDTTILVSTNAVAAEANWDGTHTYGIDDLVNRDALVTLAGDIQVVQGRAWKSKISPNLNHDPATDDGTRWEDQGPTNPFLMYGDSATRQTTHADSLDVVLQMPTTERVDTAWFGNLSGTALRLIQTDPDDGVISDVTYSLVADSGIMDWYRFFSEPIRRKAAFLAALKPMYSGSLIEAVITEAGQTVGCGAMVLGFGKDLGGTRWDLKLSNKDYTDFAEDAFGDERPVKRPYKRLASFSTVLDNGYADELDELLTDYRATPVLIVADPGFAVSAIWGIVTFSIDVPGPAASYCSLDVRSRAQ